MFSSHRKPWREWYRSRLLVFGKTVAEALACGCEFAQLVPHHFFRDGHRKMKLAIMHHEFESHKIGQNRAAPCICANGRIVLESLL